MRFLLAAVFWIVLAIVALRQWRRDREERDHLIGLAALFGFARETVMFLLEYGTFRGFIPKAWSYRIYPPLEHALTDLARIILGYAFLRYYLAGRKASRVFLQAGLSVVVVLYAASAFLWVTYLDAHPELFWRVGADFAGFWGEMAFEIFGAVLMAAVVPLLLFSSRVGRKTPKGLLAAFLLLFLDDLLMIVNLATGFEEGEAIFSPIRNFLGISAIPMFLGVYWHDLFQRLREERARNTSILEALGDGISIQTPDLKVVYQNPRHREMIGDHVGEHCYAAYEGRDVACGECPVLVTLRDGKMHTVERRIEREGGELHVEITASPLRDAAGNIVAGIESVRDISGRKRLEEQFRHAQRMEAIGRLAGGVAHDFNNLLTAINGYCDLLLAKLEPKDPNRPYVVEISHAGERAAALTGQLLSFSRRQPDQPMPVDPGAVASEMESILRRLIGEDIDLQIRPVAKGAMVLADPGHLGQVIMNLAVNARDAMPRGGRLSIEIDGADPAEPVEHDLGMVPPGRYVRLSVRDTGCGIDGKVLPNLFEPFFTTKGKGKGTGLGLSTVYGIVRNIGGHIGVDTVPGRGSVFSLYLPRLASVEATWPKEDSGADVPGGKGETVLLAEDEENVRDLTRQVLLEKGYEVVPTENGAEALSRLAELPRPPALLITDVVMPGMSGFDLAKRVRAFCGGIRVLYMSGYPDSEFLPHGHLSEGMHFLQKPFTAEALARKVREALDAPETLDAPGEPKPAVSGP